MTAIVNAASASARFAFDEYVEEVAQEREEVHAAANAIVRECKALREDFDWFGFDGILVKEALKEYHAKKLFSDQNQKGFFFFAKSP